MNKVEFKTEVTKIIKYYIYMRTKLFFINRFLIEPIFTIALVKPYKV